MFSSALIMVRQRRPTGPMWTVDDAWKRDVLSLMKTKGISRADLARLLTVKPSAITNLFKPHTKQTRLKPAIHRHLGLTTPSSTPAVEKEGRFAQVVRDWPKLTDDQRDVVIATIAALAAKH